MFNLYRDWIVEIPENQISTKRGFPVYRMNPSVSATNVPTRTKRINVPGGRGSVLIDNSTGELKGIVGMGFSIVSKLRHSECTDTFVDQPCWNIRALQLQKDTPGFALGGPEGDDELVVSLACPEFANSFRQ